MTRDQVYQAMKNGDKVTHTYFTQDEYYHLVNGKIMAEDGVNHTSVFWEQDFKKDGWEIKLPAIPLDIKERARIHAHLKENFDESDELYHNPSGMNAYHSYITACIEERALSFNIDIKQILMDFGKTVSVDWSPKREYWVDKFLKENNL